MISFQKGNAIDIAIDNQYNFGHGCNCFNKMGKGIALEVKHRLNPLWQADLETKVGDREKVGTFTWYDFKWGTGFNLYTQYWYSNRFVTLTPKALVSSVNGVLDYIAEGNRKPLVLPRIGCGAAQGQWELVRGILTDASYGNRDIIVVEFDG